MLTHFSGLIESSWRYVTTLPGFLNKTIGIDEAKTILKQHLQNREESFLAVLERGIYGNPHSPYLRLLKHAGYEFEDVRAMVRDEGLEEALSQLHDNGVYVTLDEFKGRTPIRRQGLEFPVSTWEFDNPMLQPHYEVRTGGSRGAGSPVPIDFDFVGQDSAAALCNLVANGVADRPVLLCQASPPSMSGLGNIFRFARARCMPVKWLSPSKPRWNRQGLQGRAMLWYTLLVSRLLGCAIPKPEYLRRDRLAEIVDWLAESTRKGTPALAISPPSQSVRICLAAEDSGADISGTVFYGAGEPYTDGKQAVQMRVGASTVPTYAMQEAGSIALKCGAPMEPDDMHILRGKLAVLPRTELLDSELDVQALFLTSLLKSAPKVMLNVESGDYGVLEERHCGCMLQELGLSTHIHHVRSYEKLTSEGVMFMGSMLHELLEETLPTQYGGSPLDYQLVEEEEDGVTRVSVLASPRIGPLDDQAVIETVLSSLGFAEWSRRQADIWRRNNTLRVQRREPYTTGAGKILPLHVLPSAPTEASTGR